MWTRFAMTGDPNVEGIIQWPAYNKEDDKYMYIADPLEIKTGFSKIDELVKSPADFIPATN